MEERKNPERGDVDANKPREKSEATGNWKDAREMRRANIAGERYEKPAKTGKLHEPGSKKTDVS
jgi:hypothetical protein